MGQGTVCSPIGRHNHVDGAYDPASPGEAGLSFSLRADRSLIRSDARSRRHVAVELVAPEAQARAGRLPVNLAFVIDRSGSMYGAKLAHALRAVQQGLRSLHEGDRFAVVAYDESVQVVAPSSLLTADSRHAAEEAVELIRTGGGTALHSGWFQGCEEVAAHLAKEAVGRCLLLTDGLANLGLTDHEEIVRQSANRRDQGVVTSTFGVGADFDETLLRRMADAGGGNFQFIEAAEQIADFVASEVGEALTTTVREAVLVVDAGEGAVVESLNDFPCKRETDAWRIPIGSLYSGQRLTPVLGITLPEGAAGESREVTIRVEDQDNAMGGASATIRFTWASQAETDAQPHDRSVAHQVAVLYAARAERDALEWNRRRDFGAARHIIEECIARLREYAGDDGEIDAILADLKKKASGFARRMDPMASKSSYSLASQTLTGRIRIFREPGTSGASLVPSEWDAQAAVARILKKVADAHPILVSGLDLTRLSETLGHVEKRGCLLDLRLNAENTLEVGLQAPDLCRGCRIALSTAGLESEQVNRLTEALRLLGAPSGVVH